MGRISTCQSTKQFYCFLTRESIRFSYDGRSILVCIIIACPGRYGTRLLGNSSSYTIFCFYIMRRLIIVYDNILVFLNFFSFLLQCSKKIVLPSVFSPCHLRPQVGQRCHACPGWQIGEGWWWVYRTRSQTHRRCWWWRFLHPYLQQQARSYEPEVDNMDDFLILVMKVGRYWVYSEWCHSLKDLKIIN